MKRSRRRLAVGIEGMNLHLRRIFTETNGMRPGATGSSKALPTVAAKLLLATPCSGICQVIVYSLTPSNLQPSIL
jgi:hypothetical protein